MAEQPEFETSEKCGCEPWFLESSTSSDSSTLSGIDKQEIEDSRSLGLLIDEHLVQPHQIHRHFHTRFWHAAAFHDEVDDISIQETKQPFSFQQGVLMETDCEVCMTTVTTYGRVCCNQVICDECVLEYLTEKIQDGHVHFSCPAFGCRKPVSRDEILCRVTEESLLEKYHRFITNANADPNKKTCPSCCAVTDLVASRNKYGHVVICKQCSFAWCFDCQSPSHEGLKCKDNLKGLKALKTWTKATTNGQRNARKCPNCKLLIQRAGGCDRMKCTQCKTHFCYACGGRQLRARFLFGNHYERFSILGCPRNFMGGKKKHLRRFVRGSIFSGKLLFGVVGSAVLVGLLPIAAVAAVFVGPTIGFVRLHRYLQRKKSRKLYNRARSLRVSINSGITRNGRGPVLVPRREIDDNEMDLDEIMRRILSFEFEETDELSTASEESVYLSQSSLSVSAEKEATQSIVDENQQVFVSDKDEVTSL